MKAPPPRETGRRPTAQFSPSAGVGTGWKRGEETRRRRGAADGDSSQGRPDFAGAGRRRQRVPGADRALPPGAPGALLPDARVAPGCRGRPAGHAARRLAEPGRVRRARVDPDVAVPDRHEPVPERASLSQQTPGQGVERARCRTTRADPPRRGRLARALPRHPPRRRGRRTARPGGPVRADRVDLPGLRDRTSGASASPARRAHPARRPRTPREGGCRDARLDGRLGQQRPQASTCRPAAPADRGRPPGRRAVQLIHSRMPSWRSSSVPTSPPISTPWWPC